MPWPDKTVRSFQKVPVNPSAADFRGPFNKLLYTLFPADTDYTITWHHTPNSREATNFVLLHEVLLEDKPVFVLELKPPQDLRYPSTRGDADRQIRRRLHDLQSWSLLNFFFFLGIALTAFNNIAECPLPVLHGVSAIGTRLCFYKKFLDWPIEPPFIPAHPDLQTNGAPQERWDCDILDDEGERRFLSMVEEIKQACAGL